MYKLEGLIKGNKLVWKLVDIDDEEGNVKYRWWNEETNELITTYKLNRLKDRDEYINLWGKY
jgi:hypothetical protein